ncbi:polysaccharide biosynthesis/export family protein [Hymenobacter sp. BT188]|uniref:polysaccharide biosynthesis/export family protein n=1 Tax=Hymenobacter sp. BT188 TaxID=2763504 RepID=UPI0016513C39|nr:polysaccharide biosynthesis/export family protein [Hymenobacter sp. BT188]MBC6609126.1 polysaccharide biosynthesis/export family protein [Hymenobacter sp. BT188]
MNIKHVCLWSYLVLLTSCSPTRNLVYFNDLKEKGVYTETITNNTAPLIQPDDLLSITVSSLSPESNQLFNSGSMPSAGNRGVATGSTASSEGYLVSGDGTINFPVLGNVKVAGLTKEQAVSKMTTEIKNHVKNPLVNIRFLNFKITVVGEVNSPSTFTIPTERINILEAVGLAGDLTALGKRENILLIRERDGVRSAMRVNLASKELLNSPYFYLQQNDVLYVEPIKAKALQNGAGSFYLPLLGAALSVVSIVVLIFR